VSPAREYEINLLRRELVVDSHSAAPIAEASVMDAIDKLTHGFTALMVINDLIYIYLSYVSF
jgi:hypothetical protein